MVRLTAGQRGALGATLRELANLGFAGLVFSQFVGSQATSWRVIISGVAVWIVLVTLALVLEKT